MHDRPSLLDFVKNHPEGQALDKDMVEQVLQQLIISDPSSSANVSFADISGLENCKQAITESIILPFHRPELFTGLRKPSSALLLFGPPGNGKTMLAQAIACECNSAFFSLAASSLISKFVGDSEKAIRTLFTVAHILSPSILFFDEIDALLQSRGGSTELEGSRRLKTEFLIRVDGVKSNVAGEPSGERRVVVIGATNRPFDLDDAVLRRFPKKILVPLPATETRLKILRNLFSDKNERIQNAQRTGVKIRMSESEWRSLAEKTEGYSSSDLSSLCKEIALVPIRELNLYEAMQIGESDLREIVFSDAKKCLSMVKPSTSAALLRKLEEWNIEFGST
uniref:AAA+ ATPase domain-containing protein n=1 Tax=Paramoeba aestuarina TaxID=180227 RepID=A0A7S4L489_9EUKA